MTYKPARAVLDTSAFTRHRKKPNNFIIGNRPWALLGVYTVVLFSLSFLMRNNLINVYSVYIVVAICITSMRLFFRHTTKVNNARKEEILKEFAIDNNFKFVKDTGYESSGVVFQAGNNDHTTSGTVEGELYGHKISLYTHRFSTGGGKSRMTHSYGVMEIGLTKAVPHIFIDSKKNNWFSGETLDVFRAQDMVELEGDFNDYFRIFAVKDYAMEVLTLLNPAFMQSLIENATRVEIEMIDDRAFIYVRDAFFTNKDSIIKVFNAAEFLILNLSKQLDTFTFTPNEKMPHYMQKSLYKKVKSKF